MRPRGYQRRFQTITTVADTTTVLNTYYKPDLIIDGTAVMQVYDLGDATTYLPGKTHFIFYNTTPEFVGIQNSDGSVWHRLPPRAHCICALKSGLTAAGVWYSAVIDPAVGDPAYGLNVFGDYVGAANTSSILYAGDRGWTPVISGASAILANTNKCAGNRQGMMQISAGTTAAGYAMAYSGLTPFFLGSGAHAAEVNWCQIGLSAAADEYICRFGFGNNILGGAHTEGAYFLYDRLNGGGAAQPNWMLKTNKTAGGAASTVTDSTVAVTADANALTLQKLRVEIASAGARSDFWINNNLVSAAGGQGNLPASTTALKLYNFGVTGSAYTTLTRGVYSDYHWIQSYPTVLR